MNTITDDILLANKQIREHIRTTPLEYATAISRMTKAAVFLKCEHMQHTGAFKWRGAANTLLSLNNDERRLGVVTASSGNHAAAVAYGLNKFGITGTIFVPENTSSAKIDNIRNHHAHLQFVGTDCLHAESHAREYASTNQMLYVSPYNDARIIAGQGTIALELLEQMPSIDAVFVPVGGGGLIAGIAGYLKAVAPHVKIIGCLPENSPVMAESVRVNRIVDMETTPTLSDATAGGIETNAITLAMCQAWVDAFVLVPEKSIKDAIVQLIKTQRLLVEGASGVALAAFLKESDRFRNQNVAIILSGGNISIDTLQYVLS